MRSSAVIFTLLVAAPLPALAQERAPNPVVATDAPDPGVLRIGDTYYMVTTGDFKIRTSKDLAHWQDAGNVFNGIFNPAAWGKSDFWAPEIHEVGSKFVCYYTARDASGRLSLGAAVADAPGGPYHDQPQPLVRDPNMGMIDPTEFEDPDGTKYLYWKSDGNAVGVPCHIYVQQLSPDGLSLVGDRVSVLTNDQPWEGAVVEGPQVVKRGGYYYLFYSGNSYADSRYAVGVARSTSPTGPFEKDPAGPILHSGGGAFVGPGHNSIVTDPAGNDFIVFHAWPANAVGSGREVLVDRVRWENGWPAVNDGTPAPSFELPAPAPTPAPRIPSEGPAKPDPSRGTPPRPMPFWTRITKWLGEVFARIDRTPGIIGMLRTGSRSAGSSTSGR